MGHRAVGLLRLILILREARCPAGGKRTGAQAAALSASFAGLSALISRAPDDPPQRIWTDVARQSGCLPWRAWPVSNRANSLILKIPRRVQFQLRQVTLKSSRILCHHHPTVHPDQGSRLVGACGDGGPPRAESQTENDVAVDQSWRVGRSSRGINLGRAGMTRQNASKRLARTRRVVCMQPASFSIML